MSIVGITYALRDLLRRPAEREETSSGFTSGDTLAGVFQACLRTLNQAVETMSEEDMVWRPFPETPSAGYYLWHVARVQDALIHKQIHFQEPPKDDLLEYLRLTFQAVLRTIDELGPQDLDIETAGGMQHIRYLIILTTHANLHAGAINHIREVLAASREVPTEI